MYANAVIRRRAEATRRRWETEKGSVTLQQLNFANHEDRRKSSSSTKLSYHCLDFDSCHQAPNRSAHPFAQVNMKFRGSVLRHIIKHTHAFERSGVCTSIVCRDGNARKENGLHAIVCISPLHATQSVSASLVPYLPSTRPLVWV